MDNEWKKQVTLNPPNVVILRENPDDNKYHSWIQIINQGRASIIFKVKTTNPNSYVVRPNQGVIESQAQVSVKIQCNQLSQETLRDVVKDKFLV